MPCPICRDPRTPGNEPCPIHASYGEEIEPTVRRQSGSSPPPPAADEPLSEIEPTVIRNPSRPRSGDFAAFEFEPTDIRDISAVVSEPTQLSDPLIGKQIGEYVVRRAIGAGGMGIVYEGFQPLLERRVAIKFLRPETGQDPSHVSRLLAEARAANAVRHRGIIDVFGFGELPGFGQYMVMEFLEGSPLDAIFEQRAPLPEREAIRILDEVLAALGAAHARGVIHRDLKPSNIFLVTEPTGATT
ncbi:MAG: serine/threonine-protein kinase [Myxococcales bacterium]|jgi:serine/threonine protein kinase